MASPLRFPLVNQCCLGDGSLYALGRQAMLFFLWAAARGSLQEASQGGLARISVQRVGGLRELNAVKQALNVARDRVRGHDERGVKRRQRSRSAGRPPKSSSTR
jgi:hypothetical protein